MPDALATIVTNDWKWLTTHLLLLVFVVGLSFAGLYTVETIVQHHDEKVAAALQSKLGIDTATQAALLSQLQQAQTANAVRDAAQTKLIQSLVSEMEQQRAATAKQVATDATLTAKEAADRLTVQTKAAPGQATAVNDTVVLDLPLTRTVVADLDLLPQAQADVTNLQGQLGAQQILTTDARAEAQGAQAVIAADKVELIATIKADVAACDVRVDAQVKKDLKRGFWASLASFIGGVVVRGAL